MKLLVEIPDKNMADVAGEDGTVTDTATCEFVADTLKSQGLDAKVRVYAG